MSVLKLLDEEARKELTPLKLRKKAAKFARDTVKNQMKSFKVLFSLTFFLNTFLLTYPREFFYLTVNNLYAFRLLFHFVNYIAIFYCHSGLEFGLIGIIHI